MRDKGFALREVDRVEIVTLMDNYVDLLLRNTDVVTRPVRAKGKEIPTDTLAAEHGLSLLLTLYGEGVSHTILFDTGYSAGGVPRNLRELDIDLKGVEVIVLSHGHMDHTGSLFPILDSLSRPVPVVAHPDAFHSPRYLRLDDGRKLRFPNTLKRDEFTRRGVEIVDSRGPRSLAGEMVLVTGEVDRVTPFEKGLPNAVMERNGKEVKDPVRDDQSLVMHLRGKGLVVISGCAHSGIVNTVLYAKKLTGVEDVHTLIGGFHLSGPAFEPILEETIEAVKKMDPRVIVPMHCTGWKAIQRFSEAFPGSFVLNSVGSRFTLS